MNKNNMIGLVVICLIVIGSLSVVLAYSINTDINPTITEEKDYSLSTPEAGALQPEPEKGIIKWSNPRYKDGSMINWQSKK